MVHGQTMPLFGETRRDLGQRGGKRRTDGDKLHDMYGFHESLLRDQTVIGISSWRWIRSRHNDNKPSKISPGEGRSLGDGSTGLDRWARLVCRLLLLVGSQHGQGELTTVLKLVNVVLSLMADSMQK